MFNSSPSLADIAAVTGGNRNDGAWGDGGWWVLIILFALWLTNAINAMNRFIAAFIPQLRLHRLISREDLTIQQS
jgi:hypothetical protein